MGHKQEPAEITMHVKNWLVIGMNLQWYSVILTTSFLITWIRKYKQKSLFPKFQLTTILHFLGLSSTCSYVDVSSTRENHDAANIKKYFTTYIYMLFQLNGTLKYILYLQNNKIMSNFIKRYDYWSTLPAIFYTTVAMCSVLPGL